MHDVKQYQGLLFIVVKDILNTEERKNFHLTDKTLKEALVWPLRSGRNSSMKFQSESGLWYVPQCPVTLPPDFFSRQVAGCAQRPANEEVEKFLLLKSEVTCALQAHNVKGQEERC